MNQHLLTKTMVVIATVLCVIFFPQSSYAQLRAQRNSVLNFAPQLTVGRTTVLQNTDYAEGAYLASVGRGMPSAGNYRKQAVEAGLAFQGRTTRGTVSAAGTSILGDYRVQSQMISYFGFSPSARKMGNTYIPTGRGALQLPITPSFADYEIRQLIGEGRSVVTDVSLEEQLLLAKSGGAEHDDPLTDSITCLPNSDEAFDARLTHGEMLSARLEARRESYINQAWRMLKQGDFIRGRSAFGIANMLDDGQLTPRIGEFLVDIAEGRYLTAAVELEFILQHNEDPFDAYCPLSDVLPDTSAPSLADVAMANVVARADAASEDSGPLAVHAYLLWLDGQRDMAISVAEQIHRDYRDSPYATMADKMREYMESGKQAGISYSG